jgi:hypothetical protein
MVVEKKKAENGEEEAAENRSGELRGVEARGGCAAEQRLRGWLPLSITRSTNVL